MEDLKNITPEQYKAVEKVLSKARLSLLGSAITCFALLVLANVTCLALEKLVFVDADPNTIVGFRMFCAVANSIVVMLRLNRKMKECDDIVNASIKDIVKK
jgi:hypothetical protein